jgi:hypothetical protein
VVVFNSPANLPIEIVESLPKPGVIYLALGGIVVSDATPADDLIVPLEAGVPVTTLATADLRQSPFELDGEFSNVVSRIPAEASVNADAISPDGQWVRVVHEGFTGWLRSSVLPDVAEVSGLVEIGPDDFTRMQSLNVELPANSNSGACTGVYPSLIIQGPSAYSVDVAIGGIPVQIQSSVLVLPLPDNHVLVVAFTNAAVVYPNDPDQRTIIPAGFMAEVDLTTGEFVTVNPFPGTNITPISPTELLDFLNALALVKPTNIFHYSPEQLTIDTPSQVSPGDVFITYIPTGDENIIDVYCSTGALPPEVCAVYEP